MRKSVKRFFTFLFILFVAFEGFVFLTDKFYLHQAIWYNFSDIDDYKKFKNHKALAQNGKPWGESPTYNTQEFSAELSNMHKELGTVAFVVIKDRKLVHEQYFGEEYNAEAISGSFSMAKSYVGAMIGIALKQGKIKSLDQKAGDFLPEFKEGKKANISIMHLLTMSSGLSWHESYANPLASTTECYYGNDIQKVISKLEVIEEPGVRFNYLSGDTQVLGLVLRKIYNKSLTAILSKELWLPLQATNDVLWSVDKNGIEKAFCCMSATARDFARLGQLYIQKGNWGGHQIIDSSYVEQSVSPAQYKNGEADFYGYQWWLVDAFEDKNDVYYMRGIHGQYVICFPNRNIVVVRLGKKREQKSVYLMIEEIIDLDNKGEL